MKNDADKILKRVFGVDFNVGAEEFVKLYLSDVKLPEKVTSIFGGDSWTSVPGLDSYGDQASVIKQASEHDWIYPKEDIDSLETLNRLIGRSDFMQSSRAYDSLNVKESDDVARSEDIYHSQNVVDSKNIYYCSWVWDSEYLLGCTRSGNSTFSIGLVEGVKCADSYRVYGSHKITRSLFIKSCYDMSECMFCSHMQHKKYCIANMQYTEEEYYKLKKKILSWLF